MRRFVLSATFVLSILYQGIAQIRLGTLIVAKHEVYELRGTDILVTDTLILRDSARIKLNASKKDNFIHTKVLIVGRGSVIEGKGKEGLPGEQGAPGSTEGGPCRFGTDGLPGTSGTPGTDAVNLYLYTNDFKFIGTLLVDLAGGDGGDGGKGGAGSDGNQGTKLCQGGQGGNGGAGGAAGNGGNAGNFTITSKYGTDLRSKMGDKIVVRSYGGFAGVIGEGGRSGAGGLSSSKDGDPGKRGLPGLEGIPGKTGGVFFERK